MSESKAGGSMLNNPGTSADSHNKQNVIDDMILEELRQKAQESRAKIEKSAKKEETFMKKNGYMSEESRGYFRDLINLLQQETLIHIEEVKAELAKEEPESDENDQATLEEIRAIKLRIIDRESKLLNKIIYSLRQIDENTYGICAETDEPIAIARLLLRPTATLSVTAKTFQEEKEKDYFD
ncbi:MAG: TraR/DksA C4-type zinc finger protein [Gammaproteobacteria bacterium]